MNKKEVKNENENVSTPDIFDNAADGSNLDENQAQQSQEQENPPKGDAEKDLALEIENLKAQIDEMQEKYLRLAAEYDNYRKRTTREKENIYTLAVADTVEKLFVCLDNLERAIALEVKDFESFKSGIVMVFKQMKDIFTQLGIVEINPLGQQFDPQFHDAVMRAPAESPEQENTVIEVLQKGYMIGDKVIRHAMVKVAN